METILQSPSIESFSYSWLANLNPTIPPMDSFDQDDDSSFIEMDPRLPPSKRFFHVPKDFVFPVSDSPLSLVHADELISNGYLVPLFDKKIEQLNVEEEDDDYYVSITSSSQELIPSTNRIRRCTRFSKRIFQKYLLFLLRPFFCKRQFGRIKVMMRRDQCGIISAATSPRSSVAYSVDDNWRRSCDSESSIYEAVLHCKRTHDGN